MKKRWSEEEKQFLTENWGKISTALICDRLKRSLASIQKQRSMQGLGKFSDETGYILFSRICEIFGITEKQAGKMGIPTIHKTSYSKRYKMVDIKEFWKWAAVNRDLLDFSKLEENELPPEPSWVAQERFKSNKVYVDRTWSENDDIRLIRLLKEQSYTWNEVELIMQRSTSSIEYRCRKLEIFERPLKNPNSVRWNERVDELETLILTADKKQIEKEFDCSRKCLDGVLQRRYGTTNREKIVKILLER